MPIRRLALPALALGLTACGAIDRTLEGPLTPTLGRMSLAFESSEVSLAQNGERSVRVTVTHATGAPRALSFTVEGLPEGVTHAMAPAAIEGRVGTAALILRATATARTGSYPIVVRAHAEQTASTTSTLTIVLAEAPAVAMLSSRQALTIARGGIAPVSLTFRRTNLPGPITLALAASSGITGTFSPASPAGDAAELTVAVAETVPTGVHAATIRAAAAGALLQEIPLALTVTADPLQLIVAGDASVAQGATTSVPLVINRTAGAGAVTLSAGDLPPGVSAVFEPASPTGAAAIVRLTTAPITPAGDHRVTLRARAEGAPEATAELSLQVRAASVSIAIDPPSLRLFQSSEGTATVRLTRSNFEGGVVIAAEQLPPGVTIAAPPVAAGDSVVAIATRVSGTATVGEHPVVIRATPAGFPAAASRTATLTLTVQASPMGGGNVVLDWTACTAPTWVAFQNGTGSWTPVTPAAGVARFDLTADRGGFAYLDGSAITVRYMTRAEMIAAPIDLCVRPLPPSRIIPGQANHFATSESWLYRLGGGVATSTLAAPSFAIVGVQPGVHDLVVWGTSRFGPRAVIRRDIVAATTDSIALVDLADLEAFPQLVRTLGLTGTAQGEQYATAMHFLTTAACTPNQLYSGAHNGAAIGMPDNMMRDSDRHQLTVSATTATRARWTALTFRTLLNRVVALPPVTVTPAIATLAGDHRRLQATLGTLPGPYNGTVTLRYTSGTRSMSVVATVGYTGTTGVVIAMPDLSGVPGWPAAAAIPSAAQGSWLVLLEGGSLTEDGCRDGRATVHLRHAGSF